MTRNILPKLGASLLAGAAMILISEPAALVSKGDQRIVGQAAKAANFRISFFYNRLDRHGVWVSHPRYGYVFIPAVGPGWRPYVNGHWVYTDRYGWYWVSDEPFAWATYHYGRWGYDPVYGWFWVPGNVWAPAWVTWRYGGGHVGWAPIGPHGSGYAYGSPDHYDPPIVEAWVFVPERSFTARNVASFTTPIGQINIVLGKARERHHTRYRDGRAYNPFLPRNRARQIVNQEINIYNITNVNDPDQAQTASRNQGNERSIQTFQAEIAETEPKEAPKKVAKSPDEVKSKPRLKETAKGKKPEDAPPSAAELKPEAGQASANTEADDGKAKEGDAQKKQQGQAASDQKQDTSGQPADAPKPDSQADQAKEQPSETKPAEEKAEPPAPSSETPQKAAPKPDAPKEPSKPDAQKADGKAKRKVDEPDAAPPKKEAAPQPAEQQPATPQPPAEPQAPAQPQAPQQPQAAPTQQAVPPQPPAPPAAAQAPAPQGAAPQPPKGKGKSGSSGGNNRKGNQNQPAEQKQ